MSLNLSVFYDFLAACKFTPNIWKEVSLRRWPHHSDSHAFFISHCLATESSIDQKLGAELSGSKHLREYSNMKTDRIKMCTIEFDWIFEGDSGKMFVDELARSENHDLFDVDTIKISLNFLWSVYFWKLVWRTFIPYLVFMSMFFAYSGFIFDSSHRTEISTETWTLSVISTLGGLYHLIVQVKQI
jgi:hypothetical protein